MKGDFSRWTYDTTKHYSGVLMQQGRVIIDADWNESVAIFSESIRKLAFDLFGPYGGPSAHCGFRISAVNDPQNKTPDLAIGMGRYYVGGIPCVCDTICSYLEQPDLRPSPLTEGSHLIYLDAWERAVGKRATGRNRASRNRRSRSLARVPRESFRLVQAFP